MANHAAGVSVLGRKLRGPRAKSRKPRFNQRRRIRLANRLLNRLALEDQHRMRARLKDSRVWRCLACRFNPFDDAVWEWWRGLSLDAMLGLVELTAQINRSERKRKLDRTIQRMAHEKAAEDAQRRDGPITPISILLVG